MGDFNEILRSAVSEDFGILKSCPTKWKVRCNQCKRLLDNPKWCKIVMGRMIKGNCPKHGEVEYSVE